MEHGETHDPDAGNRALEAEQAEANRIYWAARVIALQSLIEEKVAEVEALRLDLLEAQAHSLAAGAPKGGH